MTVLRAALAACALGVGASLVLPAPAQARVLVQDHFSDQGTEPFPFCGGDFEHTFDVRGTFTFVERGSSVAPYGAVRESATDVYTNLDTGRTFTTVRHSNDRDARITVNDDGTLSITGSYAGTSFAYDDAGNRLFHDAGHFRYQVTIDDGGTPSDPEDDVLLSYDGVTFGPTGRTDTFDRDFCADLHLFTD